MYSQSSPLECKISLILLTGEAKSFEISAKGFLVVCFFFPPTYIVMHKFELKNFIMCFILQKLGKDRPGYYQPQVD